MTYDQASVLLGVLFGAFVTWITMLLLNHKDQQKFYAERERLKNDVRWAIQESESIERQFVEYLTEAEATIKRLSQARDSHGRFVKTGE